ncbi:MAG TPA: CHAT domain-containing protein, partial [Oculatellaceae cyanobacterium]
LKDWKSQTKILYNLGDTFHELKDDQKAIASYQQALQVARESSDRALEADALIQIGIFYGTKLGNWQQSIVFHQQALAIAQEQKNRPIEGQALFLIGSAYNYIGNLPKGIKFSQQALVIARETQDLEREGWSLGNLATAYRAQGDSEKALELSQQSLAIARGERSTNGQTFKDRDLEALSLILLGGAYSAAREDYHKGLELEQQGLAMAREAKNPFLESFALAYLSLSYQQIREYPKAIETAEQSLAIAKTINLSMTELMGLFSLGTIYGSLGDYPKAISFYEQALAIARQTQSQIMEGITLLALGGIYYEQGDAQKTIELAQQAAVAFEASKSPAMKSFALQILSSGYAGLQDYPKAIAAIEESLSIERSQKDRGSESDDLRQLGYLYRKSGQLQQAISFYQAALATNPTPELPGSGSGARTGLARIYRQLNMPTTAIAYYKQAVSGVEQVRHKIQGLPPELQTSFLYSGRKGETTADTYRELADLLLSQGRILEAQQVLELLKVQEIRDFTRTRGKSSEIALNPTEERIKQNNGSLIALGQQIYECQQSHCSQLSQLLDQRDVLTQQFNQKIQTIEKEVRDRRANDKAFLDPEKLSLKAKQIVEAQPGTVLIYPLVLEDKIWLLWASKGGILKGIEVPVGEPQLVQTVFQFRELLKDPSSDITKVKATGKQLYDWLVKPLEAELKTNQIKHLVFSLDRAARYIPMSALFDGEKYLIENYTVSTVISADLTDTSDRVPLSTHNTSVLALGLSNAVPGFNPLPNVPAELNAIVRKQPTDKQGIYPGLEFLNSAFDFRSLRDNLYGHQLLHIATHGKFVPGSPEASYLVLGTGEKLTITQIATLQDLGSVQLVVLSACETALGERRQEDGIEINGISYFFLKGGAKAVMASLWLVNDNSTRQLMQNFYSNLAQGTATAPIGKSEALRQAQLSLLRGNPSKTENLDQRASLAPEARPGSQTASTNSTASGFSHPYYWAPFILIGNSL